MHGELGLVFPHFLWIMNLMTLSLKEPFAERASGRSVYTRLSTACRTSRL